MGPKSQYLATLVAFSLPVEGFFTSHHRKGCIAKNYKLWATSLSQKVYVYLQPLLRSARRNLCAPKSTEFAEITQNNGYYAVQGNSWSSTFIPIESSYATSY